MSNFIGDFKLWLESKQHTKYVFCDLDDTLIHRVDEDWIQGTRAGNGKLVNVGDRKQYIYERPHASRFLSEVKKFGKIYILTHAEETHAERAIKSMGFDRIIDGYFVTANLSPNSLGERFALKDSHWVLVDNMPLESVEMVNKMLVLGSKPATEHFVKVEPWYPTEKKSSDDELIKALRTIRHRFHET